MFTKLLSIISYLVILPCIYASESYVTIYMDIKDNKEIIYINGELTKTEKILQSFDTKKNISKTEVKVYFNDKLRFSRIENMRGILGKIGFSNIYYFAFSKGHDKASKIEFNGVYNLPDNFIKTSVDK